jgi:ribosome-associated protein
MTTPEAPYITLGDFLRVRGLADNGGHAKSLIQNGHVTVNGEVDKRRGKKLREGDRVSIDGGEEHVVSDLRRAIT